MPHERDHALDSDNHTGTISDAQHGARGVTASHALATPTSSGFMSDIDKTKLNGIGNGGLPRCSYVFGDQTGSGMTKTGAGYAVRRYFRFAGTTAIGRTTGFICKFIAYRSVGANTCSVRVYDETNGQVIAEQTGIAAAVRTIYSLAVSNLPVGESLFRIDLDGGTGTTVIVDAMELY